MRVPPPAPVAGRAALAQALGLAGAYARPRANRNAQPRPQGGRLHPTHTTHRRDPLGALRSAHVQVNAPDANAAPSSRRAQSADGQSALPRDAGAQPAADEAQSLEPPLEYEVPLGESGVGDVGDPRLATALLRLFAFEAQHAAAQRRKAVEQGVIRPRTNIELHTVLDESARPVPVAGKTETTGDTNGNGAHETVMRELAYLSDRRRLFIQQGGLLYGLQSRPMPRILHAGTAASARSVYDARAQLRRVNRPTGVEVVRGLASEELNRTLEALGPVEKALRELSETLHELTADEALAAASVDSDSPAVRASLRARTAPVGAYQVRAEQVATAHTVESDYFPARSLTDDPLGLSGSFTLNGTTVTVEAEDTLWDLAEAITWGEDRNRNGALDRAEDFYGPDAEDYAEDRNDNGRLDGGTRAHGVRAEVRDRRLRLTAAQPGPEPIQVTDPDGILAELGLVDTVDGRLQFAHEVTAPARARLSVDGQALEAATNTVDEAIDGVRLTLHEATDSPVEVTVSADAEALAEELSGLVDTFNNAMRALNRALDSQTGLLHDVEHVARVRIDLRDQSTAPVPAQPAAYDEPEEAGLSAQPGRPITFHRAQLGAALQDLKMRLTGLGEDLRPLQRQTGTASVYNALDRIGITAADDDTLALDRDKLAQAVADDLPAVRGLFGKPEGYVPRLARTVDGAARTDSGLLPLARARTEQLLRAVTVTRLREAWIGAQRSALSPAGESRLLLRALA